jgi:anti-anti-sigma factor
MTTAWRAEERVERGIHVVELEGELDLSVSGDLERQLLAVVRRAPEHICIDLTRITYLDSSSVRALLRAAEAATDDGKKLRVGGASGVSRRVLELTGVDEVRGLDPE